jgi:DNA polymerase-3 subunit delta'
MVLRREEIPWLAPQIERLRRARLADRFPASLLIHDSRGAGGEWLTAFAARMRLCRAAEAPCGECRDCRLFLAGQHPDYYALTPLEDSKLIRVDQVRELSEQLALTAHAGGATVASIVPAEAMNANAANALLKTLEEPRPGANLILLTAAPSRLPATVLSRCQRLVVQAPARAEAVRWLEQQRGTGPWGVVLDVLKDAPLEALKVDPAEVAGVAAETRAALESLPGGTLDIPATAERWARAEVYGLRLACIENWLTGRIDEAAGGRREPTEMRNGTHLPESGSDMNTARLLRLLDGVYELRRLRLTSINRALALEQLLWTLPAALRAGAGRGPGLDFQRGG